ncbi:MAG: carbon storage regulator [Rubripirellula sp.]|nr:carbon storage regulator [Rubripirellula sp.]
MLVLTRKSDEQIVIGDDIKITLVRVRGNSVRIGIEAPREVRVLRGELAARETADTSEPSVECEEVFAEPNTQQMQRLKSDRLSPTTSVPRYPRPEALVKPAPQAEQPRDTKLAPLSAFVSAT